MKKKFKKVAMSLVEKRYWTLILQSGLSHVLPLFCKVETTSYISSSHVMLVQRHGWDLHNIWISFKHDLSFCKLYFLFFSLLCFPLFFFQTFRSLIKICKINFEWNGWYRPITCITLLNCNIDSLNSFYT